VCPQAVCRNSQAESLSTLLLRAQRDPWTQYLWRDININCYMDFNIAGCVAAINIIIIITLSDTTYIIIELQNALADFRCFLWILFIYRFKI
jgi:hypothetical protein